MINGQMQSRKLTIHRNLLSLVDVRCHVAESCGFCSVSAFVKCLQTRAPDVTFQMWKGKVASAWPSEPQTDQFSYVA